MPELFFLELRENSAKFLLYCDIEKKSIKFGTLFHSHKSKYGQCQVSKILKDSLNKNVLKHIRALNGSKFRFTSLKVKTFSLSIFELHSEAILFNLACFSV